jgi:hypothetical protein
MVLEVYRRVCTKGLIPHNRQKDVMTALRYLASSYGTTPDLLPLTPEAEMTYRQRLRDYLSAQGKGHSTIRNSIQGIGQYLKAFHQMMQTTPLPPLPTPIPRSNATIKAMRETSPYGHQAFLTQSPYFLKLDHWPTDIKSRFEVYRLMKKNSLRAPTLAKHIRELQAYVGYLSMTGAQRLEKLPPQARDKLSLKAYKDDLHEILAPPVLSSWDDLFAVGRLDSFITWHAWRIHTPFDAEVKERRPSKPSTMGAHVVKTIAYIAETLNRDDALALRAYRNHLPVPKRIHNKQADYHTFTFAELEQVALALIDEARRTHSHPRDAIYPGSVAATRFQAGLLLMLGWRNPMRARNWCEALHGTNLRKVNGSWHWHFEGEEMKIGMRSGERNIFDVEVPPEVTPYLEEYLTHWRPRIPNAARDRHVFLTKEGHPLTDTALRNRLRINVYRYTKKHLFPHLLRSIFTSNHLSAGIDINSVAYGLNDAPATVLKSYNELQAGKHQPILHDANRRALLNGNDGTSRSPRW